MIKNWAEEVGADGLTFGERLKDLIEQSGKTAKEISSATGISESALSGYQKDSVARGKGARKPDTATLKTLSNYFAVSYEYLFGEVRATKRENLDISRTYGLNDRTAALLKNIQQLTGQKSDEYTEKMIALFNNLFNHGFADLMLDAVVFDMEMEMLCADCAAEEDRAVNRMVGNRNKGRPEGMAIVAQEDFYKLGIQKLERAFGAILEEVLTNSMKE